MSTATHTIRRITAAELTTPAYERFVSEVFGAQAVTRHARYCRWLYADNPAANRKQPLPIFVAFAGHDPVAQTAVIPCDLAIENLRIPGGWCVDFFALPSHQRKGLGQALLEAAEIDFPVLLTLGQTEAARRLLLKNNWRHAGELTHYKYAVRLLAFAARKLRRKKIEPTTSNPERAFATRTLNGVNVAPMHNEHDLATALDSIGERTSHAPRIERSATFMSWRYLEHPFYTYRVIRLHYDECTAIAVWRMIRDPQSERAELVDFVYPADVSDELLSKLLAAVMHCIQDECAELFECRTMDRRLLRALPPSVFSTKSPGAQFLHAPCGDFEGKTGWQLNAGDCDVDLVGTRTAH